MEKTKIDMSFLKNGNINRLKHLKVCDNVVFSGDFPICIKLNDGIVWNIDYNSIWRNNLRKKTESYNNNNIVRDKIEVAIALGYTGSRVLEAEGKERIVFANTDKLKGYVKAHVHSLKDVVIQEL